MFLAKLLSRLLHPIFIPTITLSIISIKFVNIIILSNQLDIIIIGVMIFTLLFPLLSILYLLYTDRIKSLQIRRKKRADSTNYYYNNMDAYWVLFSCQYT